MVVWYYDVDTAEDANLTEGDMHPARTPISTPLSAQVSRRSGSVPGTLVLLDKGSGWRQGGLGGNVKFAYRDLEKMAEVFLVCTAFRPNFLADRPISALIEVHLARPNTKTTQNGPFIFGLYVLRRPYAEHE